MEARSDVLGAGDGTFRPARSARLLNPRTPARPDLKSGAVVLAWLPPRAAHRAVGIMPFCVALRPNHPDRGKPESLEHQEEPEVDIAYAVARALIAGDRPEQVERPRDEHDEDAGEEERELGRDVNAATHAGDPDALAGISFCVLFRSRSPRLRGPRIYYAPSGSGRRGSSRWPRRPRDGWQRRHRPRSGPRARAGGCRCWRPVQPRERGRGFRG